MITKLARFAPYLILLAAFGPYVLQDMGIRSEQLIVYGLAALLVPAIFLRRKAPTPSLAVIILLWATILIMATSVSYTMLRLGHSRFIGILAGFDNMLTPLAVLLTVEAAILLGIYRGGDIRTLVQRLGSLLAWLLVANAILALTSMFVDVTWITIRFWSWTGVLLTDVPYKTVGELALRGGRLTGIFNQPFEAGTMYSLGLLLWVYRWKTQPEMGRFPLVQLLGVLVGGALSVSKAFYFIGLPFAAVYMWLAPRQPGMKRHAFKILPVILSSGTVIGVLVTSWAGWASVVKLATEPFKARSLTELMYTYTAGRYGQGGIVAASFANPIEWYGLMGLGLEATRPYDSGYHAMVYQAGFFGLMLYLFLMLLFLIYALKYLKVRELRAEAYLYLSLVATVVITGIGVPILSMNRVSSVLWTFMALLLILTRFRKRGLSTVVDRAVRNNARI